MRSISIGLSMGAATAWAVCAYAVGQNHVEASLAVGQLAAMLTMMAAIAWGGSSKRAGA